MIGILRSLTLGFFTGFTPVENAVPTYQSKVKHIIDINCTTSACHGEGGKKGDFRTYEGLQKVIKNGKFEKMVITKRKMPKDKVLRDEDYTTLKAWVEAGYPEK